MHDRHQGLSDEQNTQIDDFFRHPWLKLVVVDRLIAMKAREVARQYSLPVLDAIHLATALKVGAKYLYTYDQHHLARLYGAVSGTILGPPGGQGYFPL